MRLHIAVLAVLPLLAVGCKQSAEQQPTQVVAASSPLDAAAPMPDAGSDDSLGFSASAGITLTAPVGGETLHPGQAFNVTWTSTDLSSAETVTISYSTDQGQTWTPVTEAASNSGAFSWEPELRGEHEVYVRVALVADPNIYGESAAAFAVSD